MPLHADMYQTLRRVLQDFLRDKIINTNIIILISCRIPDDCIDKNRYPLFMARSVLRELIESLPSTRSL